MKKPSRVIFFAIMSLTVFATLLISNVGAQSLRQMAEDKVKEELHKALEEKLGRDIDVETYLKALDKYANGEFVEAKSLIKEKAMSEFMNLCLGSSGAAVVSAAWECDKWVWNSVQTWADERHKKLFYDEFLKARIGQWQREGRFDVGRTGLDPGFKEKMEADFDEWMERPGTRELISGLKLRVDKERVYNEFRTEMWNKILQSISDLRRYNELRRAGWQARNNLEKRIKYYEARMRKGSAKVNPGSAQDQTSLTLEEIQVVGEFVSLWGRDLQKVYPGEKVTIIYSAEKVGKNQFRCAYKAQSSQGDNIRTLAMLRNDVKNMKSFLGIK